MAAACEAYPLSVGAHSLGTAAAAVVRSCPDGDAAAAVETLGQRAVEAVAQARAHAVEAKAAVLRCAELAAQGRSPSPSDVRIPEAPPSRAWRARRGDAPSANATWRDTPWLLGSVPFSTAADEGGDEAGRAAAAGLASRVASHHLEVSGRAHAATAVLASVLRVCGPALAPRAVALPHRASLPGRGADGRGGGALAGSARAGEGGARVGPRSPPPLHGRHLPRCARAARHAAAPPRRGRHMAAAPRRRGLPCV